MAKPKPRIAVTQATPRRLLSRLRDVMAASDDAQRRLDKIVQVIAAEMGADVCSVYILRAGEVLELFATIGLNPNAVRNTRLRVGEGLVGDIAAHAKPLALSNARTHPNFVYRPETGEDPFSSLAGVPVVRGSRIRGVLVIQHKDQVEYSEEQVELLQTVAMVVAELVVAGDLIAGDELGAGSNPTAVPTRLEGEGFNAGMGQGLAVLHNPQVTVREIVSEDPALELRRLDEAVERMHAALEDLLEISRASSNQEEHDIIETYTMFARDRGWLGRIREAVRNGLTAEAAVQQVQDDTRVRIGQAADSYLRDRLHDFEDLTNRLLQHLAGRQTNSGNATMPDDIVLVARAMGPADLLDYDRAKLRALVLEEGTTSTHVAIVARALNIPVVGQCREALNKIEPLDPLIVDGDQGIVYVRPGDDIIEIFARARAASAERQSAYRGLRELPSVTLDGVKISLFINAGLLMELPALVDSGAAGIGLYRTELPFMVRSAYPDVQAQTELYRAVLSAAGERPVIFRTLDTGGDKRLPYFTQDEHEANPTLGWRAIRVGLDRPAMLRRQLRALIAAASGKELSVMFPLITEAEEFRAARKLFLMEWKRAEKAGATMPLNRRLGMMLEVPSVLWQLDQLLPLVDFISIGSNDLMQYMFAADRDNPRISHRYDPLSPAFLRALKSVVDRCDQAGKPVSVCGEMAGRPLEAMALLGLGFRHLSAAPSSIGPLQMLVRSLEINAVSAFMNDLLRRSEPSLRDPLRSFALDHGAELGDGAGSR